MELNKFHVRDGRAGAPSHRHPVSGRDVGVRRVEVDLPASTRGQDHSIAPDGLDISGGFMEDVNTDHAILGRIAELASRDQINTHVIIENLDIGFFSHRVEQTLLNFAPGGILIMKDASFGVASLPPEIQLPLAIVTGAAEAAIIGWLSWLHTDEISIRPARPGLLVAVRLLTRSRRGSTSRAEASQ